MIQVVGEAVDRVMVECEAYSTLVVGSESLCAVYSPAR